MPRILAFAGSSRTGSLNQKLLKVAAARARSLGAQVDEVDLRSLELPLYDGDLEAEHGLPESALRWKGMMNAHGALLLVCPEYNSSITPLLKNALDWASRAAPGEGPLLAFRGKVAGLCSASPGALGGLRGLVTVRSLLGNIGVHVIPSQFALPKAHEAFTPQGELADAGAAQRLGAVLEELVTTARKLLGE
jgi:NAD(P)H-dependent FMN reductase